MTENPIPNTETFSHYGRKVRVTMTLPSADDVLRMTSPPKDEPGVERVVIFNPAHLFYTLPTNRISAPTVVFGVFAPAGFVVEGLPYDLNFSIRRNKTNPDLLEIGGMNLSSPGPDGITSEGLDAIPAARLLSAALNAASITLVAYPSNYDGPRLTLNERGELVPVPDNPIMTDSQVRVFPVVSGQVTMPRDFPQAAARVELLTGEQRLQEVARIVQQSKDTGTKWERKIMQRFGVSDRTARRLVQEARDAGLIDPLPKTDARSRKRTK